MASKSKPDKDRRRHHRRRRLRRGRRQGAVRSGRQGRRARKGSMAQEGELRRRRTRQHQPLQSLAGPDPQSAHLARDRGRRGAAPRMFCPVPQMVGGGTVHWQGWLPRFTENDFRLRTVAGDLPGTSLADWPITYDELEPYYLKVEWAFGVSGEAGANKFEGRALGRLSLPAHAACRAMPEVHAGLRGARLERLPDAAGGAVAPLQRPQGDGGQRFRPAARRSDRHALLARSTSSFRTRWRPGSFELRPDCYRARTGARRPGPDQGGGLPGRRRRHGRAGGRSRSSSPAAPWRPRGCCCSPNPAAFRTDSPTAATSSAATSPSTNIPRRSAPIDDPIYAWAGGGYVSASTFQHYEHDAARGFVSGGHIAVAGVGIPLPINWRLPGTPSWGAEAKKIDREYFNHSLAVAMVLHDMPQHDNRIDLDDKVGDAWGLPVARVTLKPHTERPRPGPLPDRPRRRHPGSQRRERRSARSMPTRVTGNCSHQHGTARMGDDPDTSVLEQLVPGARGREPLRRRRLAFPTGTGANPTLTIMANAWRVADKIIAERGKAA